MSQDMQLDIILLCFNIHHKQSSCRLVVAAMSRCVTKMFT